MAVTRSIVDAKKPIAGGTFNLTAVIQDESGAAVDLTGADVDAFLTYYDDDAATAINSRLNQQVVTAGVASNNHTVDASGNLTWKSVVADTSSITTDTVVVARYTITFDDGAAVERTAIHEIQFEVEAPKTVS